MNKHDEKTLTEYFEQENDIQDSTIFEVIFNTVPALVFYKDTQDRFVKVNKALADSVGLTTDQFIGKTAKELFPDHPDRYFIDDQEVLSSGKPKTHIIEPFITKDGARWAHTNKFPYRNNEGAIIGIIGFSLDITDLVNSREELRESGERYRALVNSIPDIIYSLDSEGRFLEFNSESLSGRILGYARDELIGKYFIDYVDNDDKAKFSDITRKKIKNTSDYSGENQIRIIAKGGFVLWFECLSHYVYDNENHLLREDGVLRDVTGKKVAEFELTMYATMDILTNVYNRRIGLTLLEKHLLLAKRRRKKSVICFIDVNDLKIVNDTYGHMEGDRLIILVASVLKKCGRDSDIIARMGGDEFLFVLTECELDGALNAWKRVEEEINQMNIAETYPYKISVSRGFSVYDPDTPRTAEDLIAEADNQMYADKKKRRMERGG
jgi:diguanylate cyclase (GGDEF)-like protein/PAS domain S-box-containing protein